MKVHHIIAYSIERNLGKSYNDAMDLLPDNDSACFTDGDAMFLTSNFGHTIHKYASDYPNAVLTCWLNRIHQLSKGQLYEHSTDSVKDCLGIAAEMAKEPMSVTPITGSVSGTLLVVPKHIWKRYHFPESNHYKPGEPNLLGVDNHFTNEIRRHGIPVLRMNTVFLYHQYRLLTGTKEHLL